VIVDQALPEAIRSGHEIMLTSGRLQQRSYTGISNAYVAIPAALDDQVRAALGIEYKPKKNPRDILDNSGTGYFEEWQRPYTAPKQKQ
jgi:hypothetical protein